MAMPLQGRGVLLPADEAQAILLVDSCHPPVMASDHRKMLRDFLAFRRQEVTG